MAQSGFLKNSKKYDKDHLYLYCTLFKKAKIPLKGYIQVYFVPLF